MNAGRWVVAVGLLLGGCAVDQEKEVRIYRDELARPWAAATRPATAPSDPGPLSLAEALFATHLNNEQLALRGEDYLQALIEKDRAAAAFYPTIGIGPTFFVQDPSRAGGRSQRLDVPVGGPINLFNGFRDVAAQYRAAATAEQRRQVLLDTQETVLLQTAQVYYQVLRSEQSVQVLENTLRLQQERVRDIEARHRAGVVRPLDVVQARAQAAATSVALVLARNDVRTGRQVLRFLTTIAVGGRPLTDGFTPPPPPAAIDRLQDAAFRQRQDLAAAAAALEAARQNVRIAFGQYYPSVTLNANLFLFRQSVPDDSQWNALLSANLPVFTAGVIHANVRTAWSQVRQAALVENQLRRQVEQDVAVAWENLHASAARLRELEAQITAAREAFRQAEQSYNAGLATNLERMTAQDQLLSAELQQANERYNQKLLHLALMRVSGQPLALHSP